MHYMHYSKVGRIYDNHIIINRMLERLVTMYIDICSPLLQVAKNLFQRLK